MDEVATLLKSIDESAQTNKENLDLLRSIATNDDIIHYKLFRKLLEEISSEDDVELLSVVIIAGFWDKYLDVDGNGDISKNEWLIVLTKLDVQMDESNKIKLFSFMDKMMMDS